MQKSEGLKTTQDDSQLQRGVKTNERDYLMDTYKEISENWSVAAMPLHLLNPTMQALDTRKVKVKHFNRLRGGDLDRVDRVARCIRVGGWNMTRGETLAFDILGEDNITIAEESSKLSVQYHHPHQIPTWEEKKVPYSERTLRDCAMENIGSDGQDWRLVFVNDLSPSDLHDWPGFGDFYLEFSHGESGQVFERWQAEHVPTGIRGYRLINFRQRFSGTISDPSLPWFKRVSHISTMRDYEIAPASWVLESWICHFFLTKKMYLRKSDESCCHVVAMGGTKEKPGSYVILTGFNRSKIKDRETKKFVVGHVPFEESLYGGTMLVRKPDYLE